MAGRRYSKIDNARLITIRSWQKNCLVRATRVRFSRQTKPRPLSQGNITAHNPHDMDCKQACQYSPTICSAQPLFSLYSSLYMCAWSGKVAPPFPNNTFSYGSLIIYSPTSHSLHSASISCLLVQSDNNLTI